MNPHVKNRRFKDADDAHDRARREKDMWAGVIADLAADHGLLPSPKLAREYIDARDRRDAAYVFLCAERDAAWTALDAERNRIPEQAGPRSGS